MHNAMWKLALCVRGLAGWSLLKTYEDERREPAIRTATQSLENHRNVARIAAGAHNPAGGDLGAQEILRESRRYGNHLGVEFGTVYHSAAIIDDGTKPPDVEDSYCDYAPCATPGCRAPHIWLGSEFEAVSTVDLFGAGFTVLTGPGGEIWRKAAADAARQLGVPIVSYAIGGPGLADHNHTFFDHYEIGHDGAVWMGGAAPEVDAASKQRHASGNPLCEIALAHRRIGARHQQALSFRRREMEKLREQRSQRAARHDDGAFGAERAAGADRDRR